MVEALASDRSDQPFNMTVLPRRAWRDRPVPDTHGSQPACNRDAIGRVTVADEVAWRLVPRECFGDLSGDPFGGRICSHIGPDEPSALQTQDDQPVEKFEPDGRNDEQIDGGDVGGVIAQERSPTRRGWATTSAHVLGDSRLSDVDAEFQQLAMDARRAPKRVIAADCPDQIADLGRDLRPADTTSRLPAPVETEAAPMPANQRLGLEDDRGSEQRREQPVEPDEDQPICGAQSEPSLARIVSGREVAGGGT